CIDEGFLARTRSIVVAELVVAASRIESSPATNEVGAELGFDAQIAAQPHAGVGAGDVVETGAIGGADLDVFDRLGLDGKVSGQCSVDRDETRSGGEDNAPNLLHAARFRLSDSRNMNWLSSVNLLISTAPRDRNRMSV